MSETITITCDVEKLYHYLEKTDRSLDRPYIVEKSTDHGNDYYDILTHNSSSPIICDGESHEFIKLDNNTYKLVTSEITGDYDFTLNENLFSVLSGGSPTICYWSQFLDDKIYFDDITHESSIYEVELVPVKTNCQTKTKYIPEVWTDSDFFKGLITSIPETEYCMFCGKEKKSELVIDI